jgi:Mrp family chromosome partitioning ATPase
MATMNVLQGFGRPRPDGEEAEPARPVAGTTDAWDRLPLRGLDQRRLARNRVVTAARVDPANVAFDLLRTRLLQALKIRGWSQVAVTSPTKGCGKTFVAANLALSLSRRASCRTVLMDLDLRIPSLARVLGVREPGRILDVLSGARPAAEHLVRVAPNLALGLNSTPVFDAAELIQEPATARALAAMREQLRPDVVLYDLPPALACDDVIAFLPQVDAVLLIVGGGITKAAEVQECERLFVDRAPLLGVILNKGEDPAIEPYYP